MEHPTIRALSVQHVEGLGLWVMTHDSREPKGILVVLRYVLSSWNPYVVVLMRSWLQIER